MCYFLQLIKPLREHIHDIFFISRPYNYNGKTGYSIQFNAIALFQTQHYHMHTSSIYNNLRSIIIQL